MKLLSQLALLAGSMMLYHGAQAAILPQDGSPRKAAAIRTDMPITIDGFVNEPQWAIPDIGEILQREPRQGAPATEKTEVRLLYDAAYLYIGITCYDSDPAGIIATQMSRDADLSVDDRVEILIDTFLDRQNAFYFSTNPSGALFDGLIIENGLLNREWDAIWNVRAQRDDRGWSAEFAIPFKSLNFDDGSLLWGFNVSRSIRRKTEEDRWAAPRLDIRFLQVSEAGEIEGLSNIQQGRGLDIRPYVAGKWTYAAAQRNHSAQGDTGGDVFYNLSPNLKFTATINTDFAETEVDNRQINLTRFPLFFPEKRAFFLENAGVFSFGGGATGPAAGTSNELIPFFSRRVGLLSGEQVPILAGIKLAGKVARYDVGVLDVRTRDNGITDARNFFVARAKANIWRQSYVGAIYTDGNPSGDSSARTYGADVRLSTSTFLGAPRNFAVNGYALKAANETIEDKDSAYGMGVAYPNDLWNILVDWRTIGTNFRPALGFVPRFDVSRFNAALDFAPRPRDFLGIRRMVHQLRFTRFVRLERNAVESWRIFTAPMNYTWNSGDRFEINWTRNFERLFEPFRVGGILLPPGDYKFDRNRIEFFSSPNRPWKVDATWWFGTYWSGRANELSGLFQYKWAPHLDTSLRYNQTFARLKEGNFVARIYTLRADYAFTPLLTIFNLAQFDSDSKNLGWQSRIRWIHRPGREVFLVFNQGWIRQTDGDGLSRFRSTDRNLSAKAQYTIRF